MPERRGEPIRHPAPTIERIEVLHVVFGRGDGIDKRSVYRNVHAYYEIRDGAVGPLLFEVDPMDEYSEGPADGG